MTPIRLLEQQSERVETGPVQFGNDWPGTFLRGDHSFQLYLCIQSVIRHIREECERPTEVQLEVLQLEGFAHLLAECNLIMRKDQEDHDRHAQANEHGGGEAVPPDEQVQEVRE